MTRRTNAVWTDEMVQRLLELRAMKFGAKAAAWFMGLPEREVAYQIRRMKLPRIRSTKPRAVRDHRAERKRRAELAEARASLVDDGQQLDRLNADEQDRAAIKRWNAEIDRRYGISL